MLRLAREGAAEGQWLRAESQTGGKGRNGRHWTSPPGNLYASTLIRLRPGDPSAPSLALVTGVALHEAASAYVRNATLMLKWPNDLLCDGAKVAGILLEREGDAVVAGFGVNLAHHPEALGRPVTSLALLGAAVPSAPEFMTDLAEAFARWLGRWRTQGIGEIRRHWLKKAHSIGTALSVHIEGTPMDGLFDGLDETGALRLRLADGGIRIIQAGDVFLI